MSNLFEKSMNTLELPKVLAMLAECAVTLEGKERCAATRPMTDPDEVQRALEETSAALKMLVMHGTPGFSGVRPVAASLQRADMGGSLNTRELLEIAISATFPANISPPSIPNKAASQAALRPLRKGVHQREAVTVLDGGLICPGHGVLLPLV